MAASIRQQIKARIENLRGLSFMVVDESNAYAYRLAALELERFLHIMEEDTIVCGHPKRG